MDNFTLLIIDAQVFIEAEFWVLDFTTETNVE
jgi:hypothetical protein